MHQSFETPGRLFKPSRATAVLKSNLIRDLKIRRRRVSTTAAVSWGEWGEVAVVWREKLTLRSTVEEADGFITSFRGLSVF